MGRLVFFRQFSESAVVVYCVDVGLMEVLEKLMVQNQGSQLEVLYVEEIVDRESWVASGGRVQNVPD